MFQELARRRTFRLRVIGNFDYALDGVDLEVIRWTAEREVEDLQAIDIGVYPLPLEEWVTGKSGLKAIQYMAFGIPCVATDVGTTPMLIRDGENGLLVRTQRNGCQRSSGCSTIPSFVGGSASRRARTRSSITRHGRWLATIAACSLQ